MKVLKYSIILPKMPPTVNSAFTIIHGRKVLSKEQRTFRSLVKAILNGTKIPKSWKAVDVEILLTPSKNMRFDVDNRIKPTLDALTECSFWPDDSIVSKVTVTALEPKKNGRSVVLVKKSKSKYKSQELVNKKIKNTKVLE